MNEVKRYRADHRHVVETEFDDAQYVGVEDYDAKCHSAEVYFGSWKRTEEERDHAQSKLDELRGELETKDHLLREWAAMFNQGIGVVGAPITILRNRTRNALKPKEFWERK